MDIVMQMTLEEKASLCSGFDFWHTKPVKRLHVPAIMVADGPHGLRKQQTEQGNAGMGDSEAATCFPTASAAACSFDRDLLFRMGEALGEECLDQDVQIILGPGANIKRSPLCGRNFEYYSEDPFLTGEMAASLISGVQSKNVGTSLKHFAGNSQEKARFVSNSIIDERALHEIYLAGFESAVKKAKPATVMCSYNLVNGTYASENPLLLTEILRNEWGFEGAAVSDWGAVNERPAALAAGLDLEMPASGGVNDQKIISAVKEGSLSEDILDNAVLRLLALVEKSRGNQRPAGDIYVKHHLLAGKIARESAVLLKNDGLLPAKKTQTAAVIGAFAKTPRYQGSGSSRLHPVRMTCAYDSFLDLGIDFEYTDGYSLENDETDMKRIQAAADIARGKDIVFIFAGLPDEYESEGFDRSHLNLPESHSRLIEETAKVNPNVAVILQGGAPVVMPWLRDVKAVLMCYLAGQAGGEAVCGLLYGSAVPCGKLAETFPLFLSDNPSYPNFGGTGNVEYRESIFVGYRYYDAAEKQVLFPFGHGLSYTVFAYSNLCLSSDTVGAEDTVTVTVDVQNTGMYDAAEIVQIYVQPPESVIFKAKKDLRGFSKIFLKAGETGTVSIALNSRSFAYYNTKMHGWHVEEGTYTVLAGASSRDIRLRKYIHAEAAPCSAAVPDFRHDAPVYYALNKSNPVFTQQQFEAVYGAEMPGTVLPHKGGYHLNATLSEVKGTFAGRILNRNVRRQMAESFKKDPRPDEVRMQQASVDDLPLRALVSFSGGEIGFKMLESLLLMMNGHFFRGLFSLCRSAAKKDADASAVQNQIET